MEPTNLFTYGTLMLDDVMGALLNRVPPSFSATLEHHKRVRVRHQVFPGIYTCPGESVDGKVYEGITPSEWALLDWFESDLYQRVHLPIQPLDSGCFPSCVWGYRIESDSLPFLDLDSPWTLDEFILHHSRDYIDMCKDCPAHFLTLSSKDL